MAKLDKVAVWERPDGGISITHFGSEDKRANETDDEFITRHTNRLKLDPAFASYTMTIIPSSDIPTDRANRNEWSLKSGKVIVDPVKVQAKQDAQAEKDAVLAKLKISKEEFDILKGGS